MIKKNFLWVEPKTINLEISFHQELEISKDLAKIIYQRGFTTIEKAKAFLYPEFFSPTDPFSLEGISKAVALLEIAILNHKRIGVWGDFDVDGQTSTALLVEALRDLGADVIFYIPIRLEESHGINLEGLNTFLDLGVDVLLTCDTGISEKPAIDFAFSRNIQIIITDHHKIPEELPNAHAIINPQFLPDGHPAKTLCGVGTAFKLIEALFIKKGKEEILSKYLDLVAVGTIADLVPLIGDARYLTQLGLRVLKQTERQGILSLLKLSGIETQEVDEEKISYYLAPKLNALGRLADANRAVNFLITREKEMARQVALELERLNNERKSLSEQVFQAAMQQLESSRDLAKAPVIILENPEWNGSVLGIVASRLSNLYQKPAVLISAPAGQKARGSARSIKGIDITKAISHQSDILLRFGGHEQAGGFSLEQISLPIFKKGLEKSVSEQAGQIPQKEPLQIDAVIPIETADSLQFIKMMEKLAPFGPGNSRPVLLSKNLQIKTLKPIGREGKHARIIVETPSRTRHNVLLWNQDEYTIPENPFDLAYTILLSSYNDRVQPRIDWQDARQVENQTLKKTGKRQTLMNIHDLRDNSRPLAVLEDLLKEGEIQIWRENPLAGDFPICSRSGLSITKKLAVLSPPPDNETFKNILTSCQPEELFIFFLENPLNTMQLLVKQLKKGLVASLGKNENQLDVRVLTENTGHRFVTILHGLTMITLHNKHQLLKHTEDSYLLEKADQIDSEQLKKAKINFESSFKETTAYWKNFKHIDLRFLVDSLLSK